MANEIKLLSGSGHPELGALMANRYVQKRRARPPAMPG